MGPGRETVSSFQCPVASSKSSFEVAPSNSELNFELETDNWKLPSSAPAFEKRPELATSRWVTQLAQRLGLNLSDALSRDGEILTDLFERVLAAIADAETHLDDLLLARRQRLQHRLGLLAQIEVDDRL